MLYNRNAMSRSSISSRLKNITGWHVIFCLAVLAFVGRSLIPNGYMPTLSDGKGASIVLTLCSASGDTQTLLLDLQKKNNGSSNDSHANPECPFGLVMSHGILPIETALVLSATIWQQRPVTFAARNRSLPPLPALGPPLGSRAPPTNLG